MATVNVKLSSTGEVFKVNAEIAKYSGAIKIFLDECNENSDKATFTVNNCRSEVIKHILKYVQYHENDAKSYFVKKDDDDNDDDVDDKKAEEIIDDISAWDRKFLDIDQVMLFELLTAAHYLDIKGLVKITSKKIASMIKGKTDKEIRETFKMKIGAKKWTKLDTCKSFKYFKLN